MHSIANLNPKSVVSPQPYEFTELYREDQSQTTPHDSREDPGGTDLRKCVLKRGPETSPVCRGPGAHH